MNVTLTLDYETYSDQIREAILSYSKEDEKLIPWTLRLCSNPDDLKPFFQSLEIYWDSDRSYPIITYFAIDTDLNACVGAASIRYDPADKVIGTAGNIDFSVAPAYRGKGYGFEILSEAINEALHLGIRVPSLTCKKSNITAMNIIKKCNGIRGEQFTYGNSERYRFYICGYVRTINHYLKNKRLREMYAVKTNTQLYAKIANVNPIDVSTKLDKALSKEFLKWR